MTKEQKYDFLPGLRRIIARCDLEAYKKYIEHFVDNGTIDSDDGFIYVELVGGENWIHSRNNPWDVSDEKAKEFLEALQFTISKNISLSSAPILPHFLRRMPFEYKDGVLLEAVRLMVENGADVNAKVYDYTGMMMLSWDLSSKSFDNNKSKFLVMEYLLDNNADINIKDRFGRSPLMYFVVPAYFPNFPSIYTEGNEAYSKLLIRMLKQTKNLEATDNQGKTALDYAKEYGNKFAVKEIKKEIQHRNKGLV